MHTTEYISDFGRRLSELRMNKGVSARDMSLSIGQSESYINSIENSRALPSMSSFFYICEYLGVTPSQFFDYESKDPQALSALSEKLKRLDAKSLESISSVIDAMIK